LAQHTILVENVPIGRDIDPSDHEMTRGLPRDTNIQGWDIENLSLIQDLKQQEDYIEQLSRKIQKALDESNWSEFQPIRGAIAKQLNPLLAKRELKQFQKLCKNPSSKEFVSFIQRMIESVKRASRKKIAYGFRQCFQQRLHSLQNAIDAQLLKGKKVVVLLSGNFVIAKPPIKNKESDITQFLSFLKSHRYVIVNPKSSPLRMHNDPQLWDDLSTSSHLSGTNQDLRMPVSDYFELGSSNFRRYETSPDMLRSDRALQRRFSPSLPPIKEEDEAKISQDVLRSDRALQRRFSSSLFPIEEKDEAKLSLN